MKSPIRLVHITTVPGTLNFLDGQVGYLKQHGFDVHAVSSPGPALEAFGRRADVATHGLEMPRQVTPGRDLLAVSRLALLLRRLRPHIMDAHTPKGGLLGMLAASTARVPVRVYHMHGLPYTTATGVLRGLLQSTEWVSCRLAHQVVSVSPSVRDIAVTDGICPASHVVVLGTGTIAGVDAERRFNPTQSPESGARIRRQLEIPPLAFVLGFVGRIVADKGVVELVEAWEALKQELPDLHLLVVGPFDVRDALSPLVIERMKADPRIHLTGPQEDMSPFYQAMDLVVQPTYREGFPTVVLEAAAMALPIVTTRVAGCVDAVVDDVTGTMVPPRDSAALVAAIRRYLHDPDLRRRHGSAARQRVLRDFRPERVWEAHYAEYLRLLERRDVERGRTSASAAEA